MDEYERIIKAGALENPGKIELIDGYMVDKMAKNPKAQLFRDIRPRDPRGPAPVWMVCAEGRAGEDPRL